MYIDQYQVILHCEVCTVYSGYVLLMVSAVGKFLLQQNDMTKTQNGTINGMMHTTGKVHEKECSLLLTV